MGAPQEARVSDRLGTTLQGERYQLQSVLGTGGMATVYRAWDAMLAVDRAVKVLHPQASASGAIQDRFLDEARTMARLRHPNLVTVHDLGADQGAVFMVMELLSGGSISGRVLERGPMSPAEAADMLAQALDALQVAHDAGVVHRDIKPQNLLLDDEGRVKLTDFGIARDEGSASGHTRTGVMLGTWSYMSPEQRDDPRRAGAPADIYAMGATLYAMVTGKRPVDLYVTAAREERIGHLPDDLADVLRTACAYRADDRHGSAREMAAALRAVAASLPTTPVLSRVSLSAEQSVDNTLPTLAGEEDMVAPSPSRSLADDPESLHADHVEDTWDPPAPDPAPAPAASAERRMLDPRTLDTSQVKPPEPPSPPARTGGSPVALIAVALVVVMVLAVGVYLMVSPSDVEGPTTAEPAVAAPVVTPVPVATPVGVGPAGPTGPGGIPGQGAGAVPIPGAEGGPAAPGPVDPAGGPPPPP